MKNQNNFAIPAQALELAHLPPDEPFAIHCGENTLVVTPESMTALEAINTINLLTGVTSDLLDALKDFCGACEEQQEGGECLYGDFCEPGECPYAGKIEPDVIVSAEARKQMGFPPDAKVELLPDEGEGLVVAADYRHDLTDVPENMRVLLDLLGVCPGGLDDAIRNEEEVWHG